MLLVVDVANVCSSNGPFLVDVDIGNDHGYRKECPVGKSDQRSLRGSPHPCRSHTQDSSIGLCPTEIGNRTQKAQKRTQEAQKERWPCLRRFARVIRCVVRTPGSFVSGDLRVRAEGPLGLIIHLIHSWAALL